MSLLFYFCCWRFSRVSCQQKQNREGNASWKLGCEEHLNWVNAIFWFSPSSGQCGVLNIFASSFQFFNAAHHRLSDGSKNQLPGQNFRGQPQQRVEIHKPLMSSFAARWSVCRTLIPLHKKCSSSVDLAAWTNAQTFLKAPKPVERIYACHPCYENAQ